MNMKTFICRLCLFKGNIDNFVDIIVDNEDLVNTIKDCVSLSITSTDSLPKTICNDCIAKVNQWKIFKEHCWNSNRTLSLFYTKKCENDISQNNCEISTILPIDSKIVTDAELVPKDRENSHFEGEILITNKYSCDHCSNTFSTLVEYLDHQPSHEHDETILFKCDECNKQLSSREDLLAHENEHKENGEQKCSVCSKIILKRSMRQHMNQHTDKYKCELCGLRCNAPSVLATHKISVHSSQRPHCCSTCGRQFNTMYTLRVHAATHSNHRDYPCTVKGCVYAARFKTNLRYHMIRKHPTELKHEHDVVCNECDKSFKSSRHLGDHTRRIHAKVKRHECRFCEMKFIDRYLLTAHLMKHTGEKPFQCNVCDKSFARADSLKNHMETHERRQPYGCNACGKEFVTKRGRTRHNCAAVL